MLQYFGHLMWRADSLENTDAGENWVQEKEITEDAHIVEGNPFYAYDLNANQIQKMSSSKWGFDQTTGHHSLSQVDS